MSEQRATMEYAGNLPIPIATLTKERDPFVTLWVTQAGEFLYLPTKAQAVEKAKKEMSKFNPDEWWAQQVSKYSEGKKDHVCAYVKRDFSPDHSRSDFSDMPDDEFWLGRIAIGVPLMVTDSRQRSETQGQRVAQTIKSQLQDGTVIDLPILGKKGWYSYLAMNKENIAMMRKMCGFTENGSDTSYCNVLLNGGRNVSEDNIDEFFSMSTDEALQQDRGTRKALNEFKRGPGKPNKTNLV